MQHTNRAEITLLFANFCHFWTKGLHTNVQMKTMGSGGVVAQFVLQVYHSLKEKRGRVGSPRGVMGDVNRVPEDQDSRGT